MWSFIVKSNCCAGLFCALPAIILVPLDGGGGGPELVECVCNGACGGCPCPPTMLSRGMPPAAGGCAGGGGPCPPPDGGGGLEKVRLWCPPSGSARVCARLPLVSFPAAALIEFC